ncbi:MAG: leucine--tRNA ligase [Chlamydiota bacterium]|nr:leucine--tRNA ligase [Chlamydiota bacterium]
MGEEHQEMEKRWQEFWKREGSFSTSERSNKPTYYVLDMFPYPSGEGLHVGHVAGYAATDVVARHRRQRGYEVLHPMGWDSFGLQAEQYAIRTGDHPRETTARNIARYRRQLQSLGFSYDWDREITTSDPQYYRWTQWIFTEIYRAGLARQEDVLVNYCPALKSVLANEEVKEGKSVVGGYPVERRPLRQWVLSITQYAERLLDDLDRLDWPDHLKNLQRHWIGKSEGMEVAFATAAGDLSIYTTRPDTLPWATFLVIAPEHPLLHALVTSEQEEAVARYLQVTATKSDFSRMENPEEASGVWTGAMATHPITGEALPIWVGDYVLMGYGTGAVMAVPGADRRDAHFAERHHLEVRIPYLPEDLSLMEGTHFWEGEGKATPLPGADYAGQGREEVEASVISTLEKTGRGKRRTMYQLRDWLFSRQRYWGEPIPLIHGEEGECHLLGGDELPLTLPDIEEYTPLGEGASPLERAEEWVNVSRGKRETHTMPQWAGSCWYYLRFCDPHNGEKAWGKEREERWLPVDLYIGGVEHAVLHLLYARFWHKVLYDLGHVSSPEPFQRVCNQGLVVAKAYQRPGGGYVAPHEVIWRGDQPYDKEGEPLLETLEKMSKSKLNGVAPDAIIARFGADTLRLYMLFMGPFDKEKVWDDQAISGCRRFLDRVERLFTPDRIGGESAEAMRLVRRLVALVSRDIDALSFNTAIAHLMTCSKELIALASCPREALTLFLQALSPFAPHLGEELWQRLGHPPGTLSQAAYPAWEASWLEEEKVTYILQINGKLRKRWDLPKGESQDSLMERLQGEESLRPYLEGRIRRIIFIPDKLMNIVTD